MNVEIPDQNTLNIYPYIDLILGGIFILAYSGARFNTPATNRSSTTAGRYFVGLILYCLASLSFYALLVGFPHLLSFMMYDHQIGSSPSKISLPLLVALVLTVFLPKVPFLSSADRWICRQLQNMAAIPWEVLRLSAELRRDDLKISADEQEEVRLQLEDDGFDPKDIVFDQSKSAASVWTQIAVVLQKVEAWKSDRRMASYVGASHAELDKLHERKQSLSAKAKACFRLLDEDVAGGATTKAHNATVRYREDFTDHADQLRQDIFDFIARGVLRTEFTDRARENRLKAMGFSIDWPDPPFSLNQLLLLFGVVCIIMLTGFALFGSRFHHFSVEVMLIRAILISIIYSVAVACAVLPKARWSFARPEVDRVRPIGFYLVAGLMSAGISQLASLFFQVLLMGRFDWAWQRSLLLYPWLLVSFATALITAMMVDNPRFSGISPPRQRCLEGLVQGALMLGVTALTYFWLSQRYANFQGRDLSYLQYELPQPVMILVMGTAVGFVIGFFIPTWYRLHLKQSEAENVRTLTLPTPVASQPSPVVVQPRRTVVSV